MTTAEFSNEFDVLYNNVMSNQAPGLDEYEKSVFLTKALNEILLAYFTPFSNKILLGFDSSERRLIDFSKLISVDTKSLQSITEDFYIDEQWLDLGEHITATVAANILRLKTLSELNKIISSIARVTAVYPSQDCLEAQKKDIKVFPRELGLCFPYNLNEEDVVVAPARFYIKEAGKVVCKEYLKIAVTPLITDIDNLQAYKIDLNSNTRVINVDEKVLIMLNESVLVNRSGIPTRLSVKPIRYDEYQLMLLKPFKRPLKNLAWRLMNGTTDNGEFGKVAELIVGPSDIPVSYTYRYIRFPRAIVLPNAVTGTTDSLTVGGFGASSGQTVQECELDPIIHNEILQRAVELAAAIYKGDLNALLTLGTTSQTPMGMVSTGNNRL